MQGGHDIAVVAATVLVLAGSFLMFGTWLVDKQLPSKRYARPLFTIAVLDFGSLVLSVLFDLYGLAFPSVVALSVGCTLLFVSFVGVAWVVLGFMTREATPRPPDGKGGDAPQH